MSQPLRPLRAISHHLRRVLLEARIRHSTFLPPSAALSDTAQCRESDQGKGNGAHRGANCNLCPCRQTGPALGGGLGRWCGESVLYGRITSGGAVSGGKEYRGPVEKTEIMRERLEIGRHTAPLGYSATFPSRRRTYTPCPWSSR